MGQAAGTAAALAASSNEVVTDLRQIAVERLRETLRGQGAVLEGTW